MTSYQISEEQQAVFLEQGYLLLENALPEPILTQWRELAERLESESDQAHQRGERLHGTCVVDDPVGPRLARYDDILAIDGEACNTLLACPAMIAVARDLSGRGTVPLQLDVLYKQQHPHPVIKWHQGAPHPRGYPYLNVGIYLDDAPAGDGCLRYVPGTQHELVDIVRLSKDHGWDVPGAVEQPARAGDILVQDMMILHGSQPKRSAGARRTVYVELRPYEGILETGDQSRSWAQLRQQWMRAVLERCEQGGWPDAWLDDYPPLSQSEADTIHAIIESWEPPTPAIWGIEAVECENYPVPEDMNDWGIGTPIPAA